MVGDLSQDPIAQGLADRQSVGGLSSSVTEAEAKKKGFSVPKPIKLINKGKEEIVFVGNLEVVKETPIKATPKIVAKPAAKQPE